MLRRITAVTILVAASLVPASPASAHENYCGHRSHFHFSSVTVFNDHWNNWRGHRHHITVNRYLIFQDSRVITCYH